MKYAVTGYPAAIQTSRPARGAWIEMNLMAQKFFAELVAPRKGRVD